jgi:TonB family protein
MRMRITVRRILLIVTLTAGIVSAKDRPKSLEQQAESQVGTVATMCGTVVAYQCQRPERTSLLALDKPFTGPGVSVAIASEDRGRFGIRFEQRHVLLNVCATGTVEKRKNRYVILVQDPGQLRVSRGPALSGSFGGDSFSVCDVGVELPKLVREVKPKYTPTGLGARIEGTVLLEAVVLPDGEVGDVRIIRSLDSRFGLDDEAVTALKSWRFEAGTHEGRPVPVIVTVELTFQLK